MSASLRDMLPRDKVDTDRAEAVVRLGYSAIEPVIPDLLTWMQDGNWPVARVLAPFMLQVGAPLAPHVRPILLSDDNVWKYFIILNVIAHSPELANALLPELKRIASEPTAREQAEEVNDVARQVLESLS